MNSKEEEQDHAKHPTAVQWNRRCPRRRWFGHGLIDWRGIHRCWLRLRLRGGLLAVMCVIGAAHAADKGIATDIAILPGYSKYIDLFETPPFLFVALDNIGASPLGGGRITILDGGRFRYRIAEASYVGRTGTTFHYEGRIEWNLAVTSAAISVDVELDAAELARGRLGLKASFPMASLLPEELMHRIRAKLAVAGDATRQQKLLEYLDRLDAETAKGTGLKLRLREAILVDMHNQSVALGRPVAEPGDAELVSDQALLLASLGIWIVGIPAAAFLRWRQVHRRREPRHS
jgi:hypothetical protein